MALTSVRTLSELEGVCVLAPERYDPRRETLRTSSPRGVPLRTLVTTVRSTVTAGDEPGRPCLVMDTSDAGEGVVVLRKGPITVGQIGSAKKVLRPKDVVISRLRPYLRQVAFVDPAIPGWGEGVLLLCSTEFFVLRPVEEGSLAFLVPFLLSGPVQEVLSASQEGGHHPRFNEATLLGLPVSPTFLKDRGALSAEVERAVALFRESEAAMAALVGRAERAAGLA
jgi:hypothetical protein